MNEETAGQTTPALEMQAHELPEILDGVQAEIAKAVVGEERAIELLLIAALCGGHVLLEAGPGTAKTLLSTAMARVLGVHFRRVQFTPDTTAAEIIGRMTRVQGEDVFERGAVFTNVLLADEINRTPPRTQAALLEAMQERRVTVRGRSYVLELPFFVIATQNPFEHEGVHPLPESQLDRFLFKIDMEYPDALGELQMLALPHRGLSPDVIGEVQPRLGGMRLLRAQALIDATDVPEDVARYVVSVVRRTREHPDVVMGASPRASIHLQGASKAVARLAGRGHVTVEDVRSVAPMVLGHRLIVADATPEAVVAEALASAAH